MKSRHIKKILIFCLIAFSVFMIYFLFFTPSTPPIPFYTGTILEINNGFALILVDPNSPISRSEALVSVSLRGFEEEFSEGDRVEIGYDGLVMYSDPMQTGVEYIKKLSP